MSTRATYLLATGGWCNMSLCFYVHHDGYPEGAAAYFRQMHDYKNPRSGYAGRFFRAVTNSEFTKDHEAHWDTEYRYAIKANGCLTAWEKNYETNGWKIFYKGKWYDFVNKYTPSEESLYLFRHSKTTGKSTTIMTLTEAQTYANGLNAPNNGWSSNAEQIKDEFDFIQSQIDQINMQSKS